MRSGRLTASPQTQARTLPHLGERCWRQHSEGPKPWSWPFVGVPCFRARLLNTLVGTGPRSARFGFRTTWTRS